MALRNRALATARRLTAPEDRPAPDRLRGGMEQANRYDPDPDPAALRSSRRPRQRGIAVRSKPFRGSVTGSSGTSEPQRLKDLAVL